MKKNKFIAISLIVFFSVNSGVLALAHSGRTDSNGGHRDNKNKSGLGSYHYHHGQVAHLHENGVCPFKKKNDTKLDDVKSTNLGNDKITKNIISEESVITKAKENGFNDGFNNHENKAKEYVDSYKESYGKYYNIAYSEGLKKKNEEILKVKEKAIEFGKIDGYIQSEQKSLEYNGQYRADYEIAYKEGYNLGLERLQQEINTASKKVAIIALQGLVLDEFLYGNEFINKKVKESYDLAVSFREKYLEVGSLIGSSLEDIEKFLSGSNGINIGVDELKENTFIAIDDSNKNKVRNINLYPKNIIEEGLNIEEVKLLLDNFFTENVVNKYKYKKSFVNKKNNNIKVFEIKRINKNLKYLPSKLYISMTHNDDKITDINISHKKNKNLKVI